MIVISLAMVIAAAVSLFIGLFVVTDSLTFIFLAIGLCLLSLLLLWLGTRSRRTPAPAGASAPVYGGGTRSGGSTTPARTPAADEVDESDDVEGATIVRRTTARDRAATRVSEATTPDDVPADETEDAEAEDAVGTEAVEPGPAADVPATVAKKATGRPARKATGRPAKKAASARPVAKATAPAGGDAKAVLAGIPGVGPAKQDALLAHYGSLDAIRAASVEDIVANVKGFGTALATRVKDELA